MDLKKQEVYYFYGAFITTFMAVILGVVTKNYNILLFSVLGAFSFSFVSFSNQKKDIKNVFFHGLTMLIAFNLGTLVSLSLMILPFLAAFVFFISYLYCEMFKIGAPRYFYLLVLFSSGVKVSGTSLTLDSLLVANISILSGVLFSIMYILFVFNIVLKLTKQSTIDTNNLLKINTGFSDSWKQPEIIQKAVCGAFTFFILGYIIFLLNGGDSVWMLISCAAIISMQHLSDIKKRMTDRIIGSIIGIFISYILLSINMPIYIFIVLLLLFNGLFEYFMKKNYLVANIFTNPLVIMLTILESSDSVIHISTLRLVYLIIGAIVAYISMYAFHYILDLTKTTKR